MCRKLWTSAGLERRALSKLSPRSPSCAPPFLRQKAKDAMIPLSDTFMLSTEDILDSDKLAQIVAKGHSRIPVRTGCAGAWGEG